MIFSTAWLKGMGERAIKTLAQALVAALMVYAGGQAGLLDVDWLTVLSTAGLTTVLSVLTSIGNADFTAGVPAPVEPARDSGPAETPAS